MSSDFIKKCTGFVDKMFAFVFGVESHRLTSLHNIDISTWRLLARPIITPEDVFYIFSYENKIIKDALYYIKNKKDSELLDKIIKIIEDIILEELGERELMNNFTNPIILGIPTTKNQIRKRGFNPSEIIAKGLAKNLNIDYIENALHKTKETKPQKILSRSERLDNVRNSMEVDKKIIKKIKGRSIIIIDDITTTGATLNEAKRAVIKSGAKSVMCVAVAH